METDRETSRPHIVVKFSKVRYFHVKSLEQKRHEWHEAADRNDVSDTYQNKSAVVCFDLKRRTKSRSGH